MMMSNKTSNEGPESSLEYQAPLQDMAFLLNEVFPLSSSENPETNSEEELFVLKQAAHFAEQELAPINRECDSQGCQLNDGQVSLPPQYENRLSNIRSSGLDGLMHARAVGWSKPILTFRIVCGRTTNLC